MSIPARMLAAAAVLGCSAVCAEQLTQTQVRAIDSIVGQAMTHHIPALNVAISRRGVIVFSKGYGTVDLENKVPARRDSVYAIGSITKSFTALAVLLLADKGRIDLDAPVSKYLPDYSGPARDIPVRRLLNHTSGIVNYTTLLDRNRDVERAYTRAEVRGLFDDLPLQFEPGTRWSYTNSGYYLLGLIIERVSGASYYDFIDAHILGPLGLRNTYAGDRRTVIDHRAHGYELKGELVLNARSYDYLLPFSAGSLLSTAEDIAGYRRGVFRSGRFNAHVLSLLTTAEQLADATPLQYTLGGLVRSRADGRLQYSHGGEIYGFASEHAYYPEADVAIVVLTNRQSDFPAAASIEAKIARVVFGDPALEVRDLRLAPSDLAAIAGEYVSGPIHIIGDRFVFKAVEGRLVMQIGTGPQATELPLLAQSSRTFRMRVDDEWVLEFETGETGNVTVRQRYQNVQFTARRVERPDTLH